MKNEHQFSESICSSGQPSAEQFSEIAKRGFDAVINLAMPDSDNAIPEEGKVVSSLGMTYIHIPVPFDAPTADHMESFSGYMDVLKEKKVWVHCAVNARVSAFLFNYLQQSGSSKEEATSPLLAAWRPTMDDVWKAFIGER